ncbi:MAG: hypothetical protein F4X64_13170 [Chloroflexi bacterium]|nr:hypothetical protein [Chloroflexota bacterium]
MVEQKDTITIVVNARQKVVPVEELTPDGEISFGQVLALASDTPGWLRPGTNIVYTVSFRNAAGRPPDGVLLEGQDVKIQDGTIFNATATDRS